MHPVRRAVPFAAIAIALASPAPAQIAQQHDYGPVGTRELFLGDSRLAGPGLGRELGQIRREIKEGRESGQLTRREARQLGREARAIGSIGRRYGRDGLSPSERAEIESRTNFLRGDVVRARR
jgi:hypothetical protein